MVYQILDFDLVYTEHVRPVLLSEGCEYRRLYLTELPMRGGLECYREFIEASDILERFKLRSCGYFPVPADYCNTKTSEREISLILGTAKLSNACNDIRKNGFE